jgi:hypothetical protein
MKSFPKAAVAAVLALGVTAVPSAMAKDKKAEAPAAPKLKMSKEAVAAQAAVVKVFNEVAVPANQAFTAARATNDPAQIATTKAALIAALNTVEPNLVALEAVAKTPDEQYVATSLRYTKDRALISATHAGDTKAIAAGNNALAPTLDKLLANPSTPAGAAGGYAYDRAWIAYSQRQYPQAATYFERAQAAGYADPDLRVQIARSKMDGGDLAGGLTALDSEIAALKAAGKPVPADYYTLAINRLYTAKSPDAINWTQKWLRDYPNAKNWHDAIMTFGFAGKNPRAISNQERLDLCRLLNATKGLADESEYLMCADAALKVGVPYETLTVINAGKASGKISASSANAGDLIDSANRSIKADSSVATYETRAKASATGELAAQTADAYLGQANYAKAVELYNIAKTKGVKDADALSTRLGIAQAMSGDKASAKANFEAVSPTGSRKDVATLWLTWLALA